MRVRSLYWSILILCCLGVLLFAAHWQERVPALLHVQVQRAAMPETTLVVQMTDSEGIPLDEAHLHLTATMTAMSMTPPLIHVTKNGSGRYLIHLSLTMVGQWVIQISASAQNFVIPQHTLSVAIAATRSSYSP